MAEIVVNAMDPFDRWCFTAQSEIMVDGKPIPLLTEILHRVCGSDDKTFANAVEILRAAFEAGMKADRERCAKIVDNLARFIGTRYSDPDPKFNTPEALTDLHKDIAVIAARAIRNPRSQP